MLLLEIMGSTKRFHLDVNLDLQNIKMNLVELCPPTPDCCFEICRGVRVGWVFLKRTRILSRF